MNIEQPYQNLVNLLMNGRISLNGQPLTAVEHQQVNNDLDFIFKRALKADELQRQINDERTACKAPGPRAPKIPTVPDGPEDNPDEEINVGIDPLYLKEIA